MTDVLTLVFRTLLSQKDVKNDVRVPAGSARVLAEPGISRCLLLLTAVTAAAELGVRVVFFTHTQIQSLPPALHKCVPGLSTASLKKIRFSYPRTVEELLQQVASLHEPANTSPTPPSLIIVDRLEAYLCGSRDGSISGFHPGVQSCAAHLSALLCDTVAFLTHFLNERSAGSAPCQLIASFQSEVNSGDAGRAASATDPVLDVLDRYFQVRCTLDQDRSYEAAAAGLQEVWHVYFSGIGITGASDSKDCEDKPGIAQEWKLLVFPDGLMEFKLA